MNFFGITEIAGDRHVGKTRLTMNLTAMHRTLYISNNMIGTRMIPPLMIIKYINTFLELRVFVCNQLEHFVKTSKIKYIIIDGLDNYFYVLLKPSLSEFNMISRVLRKLYFKYKAATIIINNRYAPYTVRSFKKRNKYLGYAYEYLINQRLIVERLMDNRVFKSNKSLFYFDITDIGIVYYDFKDN